MRETGAPKGARYSKPWVARVPALKRAIEDFGAKLVVIDPLTAHLKASIDSWKDQSVRLHLRPSTLQPRQRGRRSSLSPT